MPRRDRYHDIVKEALIKDSWIITHDPLRIGQKVRLYVDLGAEKLLIADRGTEKIAVEIKVFDSVSPLTELQKSVGQYLLYRSLLAKQEPDRKVILALSVDAFSSLLTEAEIADYISELNIHLMTFNPTSKEIEQWID
ncbi:element excision factor XisH family protein [Spirulina major]|uniref:element excision factor XisH family protein n=1 Tax=Spirulina major TaxID=270636 RepID=UPI00093239C1|nr:element excision factor XisH family protein [Spirulina major]